jgi:hypothetical protein
MKRNIRFAGDIIFFRLVMKESLVTSSLYKIALDQEKWVGLRWRDVTQPTLTTFNKYIGFWIDI